MELINPFMSFGAGRTFFVDPAGNDSHAGTEVAPWQTIAFGADRLIAGDTLIVSGGTYHETGVGVTEDGTSARPITIQAAEGETPILDGSLSAYRTSGNSAWEVVDAGRHIYRTVATLPDPGDFGYTGRIDVSGTLYLLTSYNGADLIGTGLDYLSADGNLYDDAHPYYMGPGITYNSGHVYIRLDPNTSAAHWDVITPMSISDKDPRNHNIYLAPNNYGIGIDGDHVVIDGIKVQHFWQGFSGTGTNVTVKNLTMWPSRFGVRTDGDNWTIDNVTIEFHRPEWISRSDVKSGGEPAKDTRTGGVSWENSDGSTLSNSTVHGAFDSILALGNNLNFTVTGNTLNDSMDDGMQMGSGAYGVNFGNNLVIGAGVSHDGSGDDTADTPDSVYIHHNVFDNTTPVFWARKPVPGVDPAENGTGGYLCSPCIGNHAVPDFDDPWKIYNNTFVAKEGSGVQGVNHYMYHGSAAGNGIHEAYNNIINLNDPNTRVYRNANAHSGKEIYDYNIYARATPLGQFAIESVDTTGSAVAVSTTYANWLSSMGGSTGYYPAGWDSHSIHQTTQVPLNGSYEPSTSGVAATGALDLSAKGWPGTSPAHAWFGAKAPV